MNSSATDRYFRRKDAAAFLRNQFAIPTSTGHLAKLAVVGGGPPFHRYSRTPIYREGDLVNWARLKLGDTRASTAEHQNSQGSVDPELGARKQEAAP